MAERGLVISSPVKVAADGTAVYEAGLDPQELRCALLYWDKFAWPDNNLISMGGGAEEQFLNEAGLLTRPKINLTFPRGPFKSGPVTAKAHVQGFLDLDKKEPGVWALAQGQRSFFVESGEVADDRGVLEGFPADLNRRDSQGVRGERVLVH
jgi:hypothetical protein